MPTAYMLNAKNGGANPEVSAAQRGIDERSAAADGQMPIASAAPGGSKTQALVSELIATIPEEGAQNPSAVNSAIDTLLSFIAQLGQMASQGGPQGGLQPQAAPGGMAPGPGMGPQGPPPGQPPMG